MEKITALKMDLSVPMTSFCYNYCRALTAKLKELRGKDRVFKDGNKKAKEGDYNSDLTPVAVSVTAALCDQINFHMEHNPQDIDRLIATAEEFLTIFWG
jgi:hypothetical protein